MKNRAQRRKVFKHKRGFKKTVNEIKKRDSEAPVSEIIVDWGR